MMRFSRIAAVLLLFVSMAGTARAGLVVVSTSPGQAVFDISLDGPDATGMTDYALLVHLTLPGVFFDTPIGSAPGPFTVLTNGTTNVTVTIATASDYVFSDPVNFTANLLNGATPDSLDLVLSDLSGMYVSGKMGIARVTFSNLALTGVLGGAIDTDPANLQLLDSVGSPIQDFGAIQSAIEATPALSQPLQPVPNAAVPEPATFVSALIAVAGFAILRRGRRA